jgi:hypothetical protein
MEIEHMKHRNTPFTLGIAALAAASLLGVASPAHADERPYTYTYDTDVLPKGKWEFEQWLTHRRGKAGQTFSRWDFREEIEYGLTDNLGVSGYLNFRQKKTLTPTSEDESFSFEGISTEFKYRILNPEKHPIGFAIYFEPTYNGNEVELEEKLILDMHLGEKWMAAVNATLEQEWEWGGAMTEKETVAEFSGGLAYKLTPNWSLGLEAVHHHVFGEIGFDNRKGSAWFVGPNVHYGSESWWATLTVLPQVHGSPQTSGDLELDEHERLQIRLIVGKNF